MRRLDRPAASLPPIEDLADDGAALVAARLPARERPRPAFGVSEVLQLTREGRLTGMYWDRHGCRRDALEHWAEASGVEIVNDGRLTTN
jgi:hypothetical protein